MTTALEYHPIANLLPMPTEGEQTLLRDSIAKDGQLDPIVLLAGKILDGRSRFEACLSLNKTPDVRNFNPEKDGASPTTWVLAKNLFRRHLSTSQRAAVSIDAMPFFEAEAKQRLEAAAKHATPEAPAGEAGRSADKAAEVAHVSATSIKHAKKLKKEAPDLHAEVVAGTKTLHEAIKILEDRKADAAAAASNDQNAEADAERTKIYEGNAAGLERAHGEEFTKAIRDSTVLKTVQELRDFTDLSFPEQKTIRELIVRKWTVKKALKFINGTVSREDKIADLFLRTLSGGASKMSFEIDGWHVVVSRQKGAAKE